MLPWDTTSPLQLGTITAFEPCDGDYAGGAEASAEKAVHKVFVFFNPMNWKGLSATTGARRTVAETPACYKK